MILSLPFRSFIIKIDMKSFYKILCLATSLLFIYLFVLLFFKSDTFITDIGLEPSLASLVLARRASMFMIGISVLTFASRNLLPSKERQIICLTIAIVLFGLSCIGTYEFIQGNINSTIIPPIAIETILCLSFGGVAFSDNKKKVV